MLTWIGPSLVSFKVVILIQLKKKEKKTEKKIKVRHIQAEIVMSRTNISIFNTFRVLHRVFIR